MAKKKDKQIVSLERLIVTMEPIESIQPNDYNSNRQSDRDFELLCRSIEEDGFTQPIIVHRESRQIVDGEHRWRALQSLGKTIAPVVFVDFTPEQRMISTLRHNRARGNENINMASDVLRQLQQLGALEGAADSLMLDDVELRIMLEDIPSAELHLRKEGEKYSTDDIKQQLAVEKAGREQKQQEDVEQSRMDVAPYALILTMDYGEKTLLQKVIGKKTVPGLIALSQYYKTSDAALAFIEEALAKSDAMVTQ